MDSSRKRLEDLRRDPRVSLIVLDEDEWYRPVTLRKRATLQPDELKEIDRIPRYYTDDRSSDGQRESVSAWIRWNRGAAGTVAGSGPASGGTGWVRGR
jgi:hypothetical protein